MPVTRNNHYVPQWYQKGFLSGGRNSLHYLDLSPDTKVLESGKKITFRSRQEWPTSKCFCQLDLYTTFFGPHINDEVEKMLFGRIDDYGAKAVRAFIEADPVRCHDNFQELFLYIDSQKLRTPKGLDWIRSQYPGLDQVQLMVEMQALKAMHCTTWTEGVREIVTAKASGTKFILSDHPITIFNPALPPASKECGYPHDPLIALKGSQTIFPLDQEHCLILTNYELAKNPGQANPLEMRTHARNFGQSMVRTDAFIRERDLNEDEVRKVNLIIKSRARRYVAASDPAFLTPEQHVQEAWSELQSVLLPPENSLFGFGGEMYVGYKDGSTYYQDTFGRTAPDNPHLKKKPATRKPGPNDLCGCGSGKKFKKCCRGKAADQRGEPDELSIRERNIVLYRGITSILGLKEGKTWLDVRRELSDEQVKDIHRLYGSLWPIHTNINSLLPKPDGSSRALYTGIIDPRIISEALVTMPLYFDEVLVQSPFLNPAAVNPDFRPTEVPSQFRQETLKNILLFLELYPFIESGYVTFFPDPVIFNPHLRTQAWGMAETRLKDAEMSDEHRRQMEIISKDDFNRMLHMLPKRDQERKIRKHDPDLSDEEVAEMLAYIDRMNQDDPLALLQDDIYTGEGGQYTLFNLSPNFELSLYLAQVTGSIIITDSPYRWDELTGSQHTEGGLIHPLLPDVAEALKNARLPAFSSPEIIWHLRYAGRLGRMRALLSRLNSATASANHQAHQDQAERLIDELSKAMEQAKAELACPKDCKGRLIEGAEHYSHGVTMEIIAPMGGLHNLNVQRLLVSSGSVGHRPFVPMAVFLKCE